MDYYTKEDYFSWIISREHAGYTVEEENGDLRLKTEYATGEINYVDMMGYHIIEMKITLPDKEEDQFYLHFELLEEERAKELYLEMEEVLLDLRSRQNTRVLICCSGGLTSSYFADKLKDAAQLLNKQYEFEAAFYDSLYEVGPDFDIVLLAPQISYMQTEAKKALSGQRVAVIPTRIFGTYDASALLELLEDEDFLPRKKEVPFYPKEEVQGDLDRNILSIVVSYEKKSVRMFIRCYEGKNTISDHEVIKKHLKYEDVYDFLAVVHHEQKLDKLDMIVCTLPMDISEGIVDRVVGTKHIKVDLKQEMENAFHVPVALLNGTDAALLGYYQAHPECANVTLHEHRYYGTMKEAILREGKLVSRKNNLVGEIQLTEDILHHGNDLTHKKETKDIVKGMANILVNNIVHSGPERIVIVCPLTPNMEQIRDRIARVIPMERIPELVYLSDDELLEYIHTGSLKYAEELL